MKDQNYFLVQSEMIRYEYTYFSCMTDWHEHKSYFGRNSIKSRSSVKSSATYRESRDTYRSKDYK